VSVCRLPSEGAFGEACSALGLLNDDCIIVYTSGKCFSAARGWWTFKCFGHKEVHTTSTSIDHSNRGLGSTLVPVCAPVCV
jgi:3-mercaptopyruvate sulfurtransferase SseA